MGGRWPPLSLEIGRHERVPQGEKRPFMAGSAPIHILVVDDEAEVRTLLRSGLEPEGYTVSEAKDGAELMATVEKRPVDLITLDLRLAGEDGLRLLVRFAQSSTSRLL